MAVSVFVLTFCAFYYTFDQVTVYLGLFVLLVLVILIAIMIRSLLRGDAGKIFGYASLAGTGLLFYLATASNYVPGLWNGPLVNLDTPLWDGSFYVVQGGNNLLVNGHRMSSRATAQRYALDIVKLSPSQSSTDNLLPGGDLSQYVIYGESVYAPCGGSVLLVEDGFDDLPAGTTDPANPAGNYIAIGCDKGITVVLAHLQREIYPGLGDRVEAGQYLGKVGNTGNTTEPHLHIHAVAGLVRNESEALFTGKGVPFTMNHAVLFKNMMLVVKECPPVPGIDFGSAFHPRVTKLSITRFSPALSKSMVSLLPSTARTTP
jgi:hypothetical protein